MSGRSGVLLVGCGKMGGALLSGWFARNATSGAPIAVVEPNTAAAEQFRAKATVVADIRDLPPAFVPTMVVFAVKPQGMESAATPYRNFVCDDTVFVSIAAGRTIGFFQRVLGADAAIVRAMPNTPAAIGAGITVACPNARVKAAQRAACDRLLASVGEVAWVDDESLLDPVTAVSGSGPAYVFLLAECLAEAGVKAGLAPDLAMKLARATVAGSGQLLKQATESAEQLRKNVTSPGGTTAAALEVLMAEPGGMSELVTRAIAEATRRSRELAS